jgi:hypothetical protein
VFHLNVKFLETKAVSLKAGVNLVAKVYFILKTEIIKTTKMKQNH